MEAFLVPTASVALAEIGDKTQLLSLVLAARYRNAPAIIWGILIATLINHGASVLLGEWLVGLVPEHMLRWIIAGSFLAVGLWLLIPDKLDDDQPRFARKMGPFLATLVLFFLAEIGDKTQIATVVLAGHYESAMAVTMGTTLGMLVANVPVVMFGQKAMAKMPVKYIHIFAFVIFIAMAAATLLVV